jgi:hypothetical protein
VGAVETAAKSGDGPRQAEVSSAVGELAGEHIDRVGPGEERRQRPHIGLVGDDGQQAGTNQGGLPAARRSDDEQSRALRPAPWRAQPCGELLNLVLAPEEHPPLVGAERA